MAKKADREEEADDKSTQIRLDRDVYLLVQRVAGHLNLRMKDWINNRLHEVARREWHAIREEIAREVTEERKKSKE